MNHPLIEPLPESTQRLLGNNQHAAFQITSPPEQSPKVAAEAESAWRNASSGATPAAKAGRSEPRRGAARGHTCIAARAYGKLKRFTRGNGQEVYGDRVLPIAWRLGLLVPKHD